MDQEPTNQTRNEIDEQHPILTESVSQPSKKARSSMRGFFGGFIGGVLAVALVVVLLVTQVISIPLARNDVQGSPTTNQAPTSEANVTPVIADATEAGDLTEASEAVVGIINLQNQSVWDPQQEAGSGSGIVYKKENGKAYIVTNHHVVNQASEVEVETTNEERVRAKVIGSDPLTDLAVLEVDDEHFQTVATLGSSEELNVGETVYAIGNPLGMDFSGSVTKGIVSGLNRLVKVDTTGNQSADWIMEVIQTDAAINPGNSGGALVNSAGQVIGINSMKINQQAVEGIGFAIPIDEAIPMIEQLEQDGEVTRPFVGIAGVQIEQVPQQYVHNINIPEDVDEGIVVANVQPGSPADEAGLEQYDFITEVNGETVASMLDFKRYVYTETDIGDTVDFTFYRNGEEMTVTCELVAGTDQ